jgi:hypothetical protein
VFQAIILLMDIYGAVRSPRFRPAFLLLALASVLWLIPQGFHALLQAQKDFAHEWLSSDISHLSLPYVLSLTWFAIPVGLLGVGAVVHQAIKSNDRDA